MKDSEMKKTNLHLANEDWDKLKSYNTVITRSILSGLPSDFAISEEDVSGAVYDTIIHLLARYKPGTLSPVSYVYQYAESYTRRDLFREYQRARNYLCIDDRGEHDRFDRREYGEGDVPELTVDTRERQELQDIVRNIFDKATPEDRKIMEGIMAGESQEEIARKLGISQQAVSRRLKKYANFNH